MHSISKTIVKRQFDEPVQNAHFESEANDYSKDYSKLSWWQISQKNNSAHSKKGNNKNYTRRTLEDIRYCEDQFSSTIKFIKIYPKKCEQI